MILLFMLYGIIGVLVFFGSIWYMNKQEYGKDSYELSSHEEIATMAAIMGAFWIIGIPIYLVYLVYKGVANWAVKYTERVWDKICEAKEDKDGRK